MSPRDVPASGACTGSGEAHRCADTSSSLFFDHHDPEIVTWLAKRRLDA
ncbi:hypothetical protein ABT173_33475 [Streptomyces sp. NPDC001795]